MFNINGKKKYVIIYIRGGEGNKNDYTFLTLQNEKSDKPFAERLKINLWGENLSNTLKVGDYVSINGAKEIGIVKSQDKNDSNKWYDNLTIVCSPENIILEKEQAKLKEEPFAPTQDADLPF